MKVAIYAITPPEIQRKPMPSVDFQEGFLECYAWLKGLDVYQGESYGNYIDTKLNEDWKKLPELKKLRKAAKLRKFDTVLVFRLKYCAMDGKMYVGLLNELHQLGVRVLSVFDAMDSLSPRGEKILNITKQLLRQKITLCRIDLRCSK